MRSLLVIAIPILLLASPLAQADPVVEHGVDDSGCSAATHSAVSASPNSIVVAAGAADHCAYLIVLP